MRNVSIENRNAPLVDAGATVPNAHAERSTTLHGIARVDRRVRFLLKARTCKLKKNFVKGYQPMSFTPVPQSTSCIQLSTREPWAGRCAFNS
jgi:hypothetical protein